MPIASAPPWVVEFLNMPRSRRLRSLANCLRALGLLAVLLAVVTAVGIAYGGGTIDAFEHTVQRWLRTPVADALAAARNEPEPDRRAARHAALLARLRDTQREDRDADIVRHCYHELADLAEARGDLEAATAWLQARHEFDDRDLVAAVRHAQLLCRAAATATNGRAKLRQLAARFPGHALVVTALVEQALADGNPRHARSALAAALRAPRPQLWRLTRDDGAAIDLVPVRTATGLRLGCRLESPCSQLHLAPPDNGDDLLAARLTLGVGADAPRLLARHDDAGFVFDLHRLPAESIDVAIEIDVRSRCPRWLAALHLRLGGEVKVDGIVESADHPVGTERVVPMPTVAPNARHDFDLVVPLGIPIGGLRIELPDREGLRYRLDLLELTLAGRTETVTPDADGNVFTVRLQGTPVPDAVRLAGVLR